MEQLYQIDVIRLLTEVGLKKLVDSRSEHSSVIDGDIAHAANAVITWLASSSQ
jgi:hypothetical protein